MMRRASAATVLTAPGWYIVASAGVLCALGLLSIYVTDTAYYAGHDGPLNARKQGLILLLGIVLGACILRAGYRRLAGGSYWFFALSIALLIPPVVARFTGQSFGGLIPVLNGARRWIRLPLFQIQPSEVFKLALILALAWYLRYRSNTRTFAGVAAPLMLCAVPLGLILLEPDLGTAMLIPPLVLMMLYLAGAKTSHLLGLIGVAIAAAPLAWSGLEDYQRRRVLAVVLQSPTIREAALADPESYSFLGSRRDIAEWERAAGFQLVQSKNAIGSGGWTGFGWGQGPFVEYPLLPDRHNDFVFAVIAHQWGLVGGVLVLAAYAGILGAGTVIASATKEPFGRLVAAGIVTSIGLQVVVNIGMTVGLLPVTGMTLPLVSYGGCSLLMNVAALAVLISISQHRPFLLSRPPFGFAATARRLLRLELRDPEGSPAAAPREG